MRKLIESTHVSLEEKLGRPSGHSHTSTRSTMTTPNDCCLQRMLCCLGG